MISFLFSDLIYLYLFSNHWKHNQNWALGIFMSALVGCIKTSTKDEHQALRALSMLYTTCLVLRQETHYLSKQYGSVLKVTGYGLVPYH